MLIPNIPLLSQIAGYCVPSASCVCTRVLVLIVMQLHMTSEIYIVTAAVLRP